MWGSIISGLLSILASIMGRKKNREEAMNSPEMKANQEARDEVKRQDEIETEVIKALHEDETSLQDLQRRAAE